MVKEDRGSSPLLYRGTVQKNARYYRPEDEQANEVISKLMPRTQEWNHLLGYSTQSKGKSLFAQPNYPGKEKGSKRKCQKIIPSGK